MLCGKTYCYELEKKVGDLKLVDCKKWKCSNDPKMSKWPTCPDNIISTAGEAKKVFVDTFNGKFKPKSITVADVDFVDRAPMDKSKCNGSPGMHFNGRHKNKKGPDGKRDAFINSAFYCKCCKDTDDGPVALDDWKFGKWGRHEF